jgi:hypothetical protein
MFLPKRLLGAVLVAAAAASLAIPAVAGAKAGDRTFQQTYPGATRLCAEVAAGKRKRLQPFAARILNDCSALQTGFTAAQSAVLASRGTTAASIALDRVAIAVACPSPLVGHPACEHTRHVEQLAIATMQRVQAHAARRYYRIIEANRRRYWHAIKALPGTRHLRADAPIAEQES